MNRQIFLLLALLTSFYIKPMEEPKKEKEKEHEERTDARNLFVGFLVGENKQPFADVVKNITIAIKEINRQILNGERINIQIRINLGSYLSQIKLDDLKNILDYIINDETVDASSFTCLLQISSIEWLNFCYSILLNSFSENHELNDLMHALYLMKADPAKLRNNLESVNIKTQKLFVIYSHFISLVTAQLNEKIHQINEKFSEYYKNLGSYVIHDIVNMLLQPLALAADDEKFRLYVIKTELIKFISEQNLQEEFKEELEKIQVTELPARPIKKYTRKK